jgi:hypothetical protein
VNVHSCACSVALSKRAVVQRINRKLAPSAKLVWVRGNARWMIAKGTTATPTTLREAAEATGVLKSYETIHDPVREAIRNAPLDDEPYTEEEKAEDEKARASVKRGEAVSTEELSRLIDLKGRSE